MSFWVPLAHFESFLARFGLFLFIWLVLGHFDLFWFVLGQLGSHFGSFWFGLFCWESF